MSDRIDELIKNAGSARKAKRLILKIVSERSRLKNKSVSSDVREADVLDSRVNRLTERISKIRQSVARRFKDMRKILIGKSIARGIKKGGGKFLKGGVAGIQEASEAARDASPRFLRPMRERMAKERQTSKQRAFTEKARKEQESK